MSKPPTRRTLRLLLRAPEPADVDPLFTIQSDPEAMRFTYCSPSREATATRLAEYADRFAEDGFAPWTVILAEEDRVIGWGGLNKDPGEPEWGSEVAYYFDPAYWRRGLATELVRASLAHAFEDLDLPRRGRLHQAREPRLDSLATKNRVRIGSLRSRAGAQRVPDLRGFLGAAR